MWPTTVVINRAPRAPRGCTSAIAPRWTPVRSASRSVLTGGVLVAALEGRTATDGTGPAGPRSSPAPRVEAASLLLSPCVSAGSTLWIRVTDRRRAARRWLDSAEPDDSGRAERLRSRAHSERRSEHRPADQQDASVGEQGRPGRRTGELHVVGAGPCSGGLVVELGVGE